MPSETVNSIGSRICRIWDISYIAYMLMLHKVLHHAKRFGYVPKIKHTTINLEWQRFAPPVITALTSMAEQIKAPIGEDFFLSLQSDTVICRHGSRLDSLTETETNGKSTLIAFGSDDPLDDVKMNSLHGTFKKVFSINATAHDNRLNSIPIGIEAMRHCSFNKFKVLKDCLALRPVPSRLLYGNFSLNTNRSKRLHCLSAFERKDYFTNRVTAALPAVHDLTPGEYRAFCMELLDHVFVACPEGNGLDTHRMWETLYLGRIPVALHNPVTDAFAMLPILRLYEWNEFEDKAIEFLRTLQQKRFDLGALSQVYWEEKIT